MNAPAKPATCEAMGPRFTLSAAIDATTAPVKLKPAIFDMREAFTLSRLSNPWNQLWWQWSQSHRVFVGTSFLHGWIRGE